MRISPTSRLLHLQALLHLPRFRAPELDRLVVASAYQLPRSAGGGRKGLAQGHAESWIRGGGGSSCAILGQYNRPSSYYKGHHRHPSTHSAPSPLLKQTRHRRRRQGWQAHARQRTAEQAHLQAPAGGLDHALVSLRIIHRMLVPIHGLA